MRLHRLEVEGFGPFRTRQVVDFDTYADDGIFLIAGRTGAGKSSILDAVCFGLYGGVPRYDGGEKRLRSDHCEPEDPTEIVVEFSTVAGRYRVTRSPAYERPAKRGGGMTTQQPSALLEQLIDDEWIGLAARVVDVATELDDILQLSQEQFLQVILLAQNRFADFLLADSKERQALLRRLFGTGRFSDFQSRFDERRRAAEQALSGRRATVDARLDEAERVVAEAELWGDDSDAAPDTTDARIALLRRAITRADYQVERLGTERAEAERSHAAADTALAVLKEQRQAQQDRDRARAALAALDGQADEISAAAARRDRGRAAESLRSLITAATRAAAAVAAAAQTETDAVAAASAAGVQADGAEQFRTFASERTRESGAWQQAADLESSTAARAAALASAQRAAESASDTLAALDTERDTIPAQVADLTAVRDAARRDADRVETAAQAVALAEQRSSAAQESTRLAEAIAVAARAESDATEAHTSAQAELAQLRRRRLDGYAGELASALVPGEPCAVCGSTEHPAPAEHADPVSADDVAAAERIRDAAAEAERAVSRDLATHTAALAAAAERSAGLSVEQAAAELKTARTANDAAVVAAERAAALTRDLEALTLRQADLEERRTVASDALGAACTALSLVEQRIADADRAIATARGDHATVAERLGEARRQIGAANSAADAIDAHLDLAERAEAGLHERDEALTASIFDDVTAAEQSLLGAAEIAALDDRVTAHRIAREKERALLLDLEMRVLPEEPIALAPAEESAASARATWQRAVDADSLARGVQKSLAATVDSAASEHAASAAVAEEFEVLRGLADALAGRSGNTHKMNLETFVLAAELEEIVAAANLRLHDMSAGRYQLQHSDALAARGAASGLGIVVFDAFTGHTRPAKSLSGGETFLSSLALALGLAEVVTARAGGIRLDTLFIDEGFGSLDADTLETAMRTLDELRQGGRTVGVISHVEAMQEQIPAQLTVRALPDGPSVIEGARG
ncbi:SMC family ATPase [Microbacterium sp. H1-D42]|uniref:AAA family ATPase n=1 Tax=Microbacterium sp. H1-D42 TaxID=2925844 RepID=UPI001F53DBFC|nr:SMC family ATPase [Microbacterium sp. H1-D42]UNK70254.1 SMC family ATPase [Microbacterium sp. H1-D42]